MILYENFYYIEISKCAMPYKNRKYKTKKIIHNIDLHITQPIHMYASVKKSQRMHANSKWKRGKQICNIASIFMQIAVFYYTAIYGKTFK